MHDSRLNVDVIASNMKLSSGYINRLFNSEGTSTMHFVKNSRLEKAKYLLGKNGANNKSVSEVAWLCGFSQVAHFSRSFRSRFCQSPSEYRHTERLDSVVMKNAH
jgi:transcriptional regulator GlxA family with amidase domain